MYLVKINVNKLIEIKMVIVINVPKFTEILTRFLVLDTGLQNISLCVCQHGNMANR